MEFYVLENGEILGPFSREELAAQVEENVFTMSHMAQEKGRVHWTPISRLFEPQMPVSGGNEALAPDWRTILRWGYQRLRYGFEDRPMIAAGIGLIGGLLFFCLSFFPVLFWLPWFAAALLASILVVQAGHARSGAVLLAASIILPVLLAYKSTKIRGSTKPVEESAPVEVARFPHSVQEGPHAPSDLSVSEKPLESVPQLSGVPAAVPPPLETATEPGSANRVPLVEAVPKKPEETREPLPKSEKQSFAVVPPLPPPVLLPPNSVPAPVPAVPASPVAQDQSAQLVRDFNNCLIFIDDSSAVTGSGFVAQTGEKTFLFTNAHVVAGMKAPRFTRLDRSPIALGAASVAVGHDVMRYEGPAMIKPLQIMTAIESNALIGDEVIVLGNSEGAHVILPLTGTISGIGPNLVEVTAEFVPGNSGSPIIHKKSGQVIGIATYLVKRDIEWLSDKSSDADRAKKIRRFGYRIDSIAKWQPVVWPQFNAEYRELEKIHGLTRDLAQLLDDVRANHRVTPGRHQNSSMMRSVQTFLDRGTNRRLSSQDQLQNAQRFLSDMRFVSQTDVIAAKSRIGYDYFQRALADEEQIRAQFRDIFDRAFKSL
ncbi:MAG: hypothetical protein JWL90_1207 [Chthoniobacteraceae bacterium]|nr:hypothetical protein [Chthoniobacteraceae bacterium]